MVCVGCVCAMAVCEWMLLNGLSLGNMGVSEIMLLVNNFC